MGLGGGGGSAFASQGWVWGAHSCSWDSKPSRCQGCPRGPANQPRESCSPWATLGQES